MIEKSVENNVVEIKENQIRTRHVVATEIRTIANQTKRMMIISAIEIGRRLVEAKDLVSHGSWGDWLKNEVYFSKSTANNYMKIFKEYAADQVGIIDTPLKSQTFGDLNYSQALKLLAVPSDEREEFIKNNDVDKMSTRELEEAIKRAEQAEKKAEDTEAKLKETEKKLNSKEKINKLQDEKRAELEEATKEARAEVKKMNIV